MSVVSIQEVYSFHGLEILRREAMGDVRLHGESVWETLHRCSLMLLIILPLFTGVVKLSDPSLTCPFVTTYHAGLTVKEPSASLPSSVFRYSCDSTALLLQVVGLP